MPRAVARGYCSRSSLRALSQFVGACHRDRHFVFQFAPRHRDAGLRHSPPTLPALTSTILRSRTQLSTDLSGSLPFKACGLPPCARRLVCDASLLCLGLQESVFPSESFLALLFPGGYRSNRWPAFGVGSLPQPRGRAVHSEFY